MLKNQMCRYGTGNSKIFALVKSNQSFLLAMNSVSANSSTSTTLKRQNKWNKVQYSIKDIKIKVLGISWANNTHNETDRIIATTLIENL